MKAIETTATINDLGQLTLDAPLILTKSRRVRVIVLIPEDDEPAAIANSKFRMN